MNQAAASVREVTSMEVRKLNRIRGRLRFVPLFTSVCLCIFLSICYIFQFDACAAITMFPVWSWLVPGVLLVALGSIGARRMDIVVLTVLWLAYVLILADETSGLVRCVVRPWRSSQGESNDQTTTRLKVISLNCAGGNPAALREVKRYKPDIVLLQETPGKDRVQELAVDLFGADGAILWQIDTAVIVNGEIHPDISDGRWPTYSAHCHVILNSGAELEAISLRLTPPPLRFDLWRPACWKAYASARRMRRLQVAGIVTRLDELSPETPVLIGGDFNAPAGDGALQTLGPRLHDIFIEGGLGWGNTVSNDMPVHRFDQIWVSKHFTSIAVTAQKMQESDHRMVVGELMLTGGP